MKIKILLTTLLPCLIVASCAIPTGQASIDWKNGAKLAWIEKIYPPNQPNPDFQRCMEGFSEAELAARRLAKVRYLPLHRPVFVIAEIPENLIVHLGDEVELWPHHCEAGKLSKISQILKATVK